MARPKYSTITRYQWLTEAVQSDDGTDSCREWPFFRMPKGYGVVDIRNGPGSWRKTLVHVAAFAISKKLYVPLPNGVVVRHSCDNPPCFRLRHLNTGSQYDNIQDAVCRMRHTIGERNGMSRLTEGEVREIHALYASGKLKQIELAEQFGVSFTIIHQILAAKRWGHLGLPRLPRTDRWGNVRT